MTLLTPRVEMKIALFLDTLDHLQEGMEAIWIQHKDVQRYSGLDTASTHYTASILISMGEIDVYRTRTQTWYRFKDTLPSWTYRDGPDNATGHAIAKHIEQSLDFDEGDPDPEWDENAATLEDIAEEQGWTLGASQSEPLDGSLDE